MTTEEIKQAWEKTVVMLEQSEARNLELSNIIKDRKKKTALQNLASRYLRFCIFGICAAVIFGFAFSNPHFEVESSHRLPLVAFMTAFFILASVMDFWLYKGVSGIDCATMSVSEVLSKALFYRKRHLQFVAFLLPLAFGLVGYEFVIFSDNDAFVAGGIVGGIIGLGIGIIQLMKFMSDYKSIMS